MADIIDLLRLEHEEALRLADALCRQEENGQKRREIFHQLKGMLQLHNRTEEAAVYETLKAMREPDSERLVLEGYVEHNLLDYLFEKLARSSATTSPSWTAHAMVLKGQLQRHVEGAHTGLFALLGSYDETQRRDMAAAFLAAKSELAGLSEPAKRRA